jgi:hypothetical protein
MHFVQHSGLLYFWTLSGVLETRKYNDSETDPFSEKFLCFLVSRIPDDVQSTNPSDSD